MKDAIKKFAPQNFNDLLALIVAIGVPIVLAVATAIPAAFQGTMAAAWLLVIQYYFRKKSGETTP